MKPYVRFTINTRAETIGWSVGERLIDSLAINDGALMPEYVSHNADKVTDPFVNKSKAENLWAEKATIRFNGALSEFYQDFAWRRRKNTKYTGRVCHTFRDFYGKTVPGSICLTSACNENIDWYLLFKTWCEIFPPQLGMLHLFSKPELGSDKKYDSFQLGIFNEALNPDVPNIGWAMFYGDEFAEAVDSERISAAGFPVEKMGNGYLVRVTENIQDIVSDFSVFSKRRAELKSLFPAGFFLIEDEPLG
ncbi:hypothetical protein [Microvirgula curvata]